MLKLTFTRGTDTCRCQGAAERARLFTVSTRPGSPWNVCRKLAIGSLAGPSALLEVHWSALGVLRKDCAISFGVASNSHLTSYVIVALAHVFSSQMYIRTQALDI